MNYILDFTHKILEKLATMNRFPVLENFQENYSFILFTNITLIRSLLRKENLTDIFYGELTKFDIKLNTLQSNNMGDQANLNISRALQLCLLSDYLELL